MNDSIKYDLKTMRLIMIIALIFTGLFFASFFDFVFEQSATTFSMILFMICGVSFIPAIIMWIYYIDGKNYIRELKRAGYEVPESKKDYGNRISNLPKEREVKLNNEGKCGYCMVMFYITAVVTLACAAAAINYCFMWYGISDSMPIVGGIVIIMFLWGMYSYRLYREADNTVYRSFFENDETRKCRKSAGHVIITVILAAGISWFACQMIFDMTEYVAKSRISYDVEDCGCYLHEMEQNSDEGRFITIEQLEEDLKATDARAELRTDESTGEKYIIYSYDWKYRKRCERKVY